jgi:hypothetical protein
MTGVTSGDVEGGPADAAILGPAAAGTHCAVTLSSLGRELQMDVRYLRNGGSAFYEADDGG